MDERKRIVSDAFTSVYSILSSVRTWLFSLAVPKLHIQIGCLQLYLPPLPLTSMFCISNPSLTPSLCLLTTLASSFTVKSPFPCEFYRFKDQSGEFQWRKRRRENERKDKESLKSPPVTIFNGLSSLCLYILQKPYSSQLAMVFPLSCLFLDIFGVQQRIIKYLPASKCNFFLSQIE